MKIQIQDQQLRWRIDENELATLLEIGVVKSETHWSANAGLLQRISLHSNARPVLMMSSSEWELSLPRETLLAYVERLPCRDALVVEWQPDRAPELQVMFEVDVRDSKRVRGRSTKSRD